MPQSLPSLASLPPSTTTPRADSTPRSADAFLDGGLGGQRRSHNSASKLAPPPDSSSDDVNDDLAQHLCSAGNNTDVANDCIADELDDSALAPLAIRLSPAVDITNLSFRINAPPTDRAVRIYCDGIFDLFHYGHARCLEQAKNAFSSVYLLVGVCNDSVTHKFKGKTVMTDIERVEALRHCAWVDQVVPDAPWIIDQDFIDTHHIDYVAHDNIPYASGAHDDVYAFIKLQGRFLPTRRTEGISTSDLITRIVRDYDEYLRRNLARGVSPKDLNIGFFKEKRLQVAQSVQEIKDEIRSEFAEWKDEWLETVRTWEERSSNYIKGFVELFRNGPELMVKLLRIKSPKHEPAIVGTKRAHSADGGRDGRKSAPDDGSGSPPFFLKRQRAQ